MRSVVGFDELCRDANAGASLTHGAFDEVGRPQRLPDRLHIAVLPLNWNADVRATTRKSAILASAAVISSVMPSEKNSCSGSLDRFVNGSTARETAVCDAAASFAASTPACRVASEEGAICW